VKNFGLENLFDYAYDSCQKQNAQILSSNDWNADDLLRLATDLSRPGQPPIKFWVSSIILTLIESSKFT
jgi:hypothetical protein